MNSFCSIIRDVYIKKYIKEDFIMLESNILTNLDLDYLIK